MRNFEMIKDCVGRMFIESAGMRLRRGETDIEAGKGA